MDTREREFHSGQITLRGETEGEGDAVILVHGLTATRRYVLHGSSALARAGYEVTSYDARGHGRSDAPADGEYGYEALAADLEAVAEAVAPGGSVFFAGHSMGAHTIAALALANPERIRAAALVGPAYPGLPTPEDELGRWDELAGGLDRDGVEGFLEVYGRRDWPDEWRETIMRITRERLERHENLGAVADAIRAVPRSGPFGALSELEQLRAPTLVVASHDEADPGHPYEVASEWARHLPNGRLTSEDEGASPLAWQGGRLARELASFFDEHRDQPAPG